MDNLIYLANIVLGLAGLAVAVNIRLKKATQKPLVCPLNMKCEQVLYSKYANFLGIPLEILGIIYYALTIISYSSFLTAPAMKTPGTTSVMFLISGFGFLFSLYLLAIQSFKLKEWCSWCLMSAAISTAIFILSLQTGSVVSALNYLTTQYVDILVLIYALAISIGFGFNLILEILFLKFVKDRRISKQESDVLHIVRQLTWLALGIMVVSNYALYSATSSDLEMSPKFVIKIMILAILVIGGLIYDLFVSSKLIEIYSDEGAENHIADKYLKLLPFLFGPVFIVSWLAVLIVELSGDLPLSIIQFSIYYALVILAALLAGGLSAIRTVAKT